MLYYIYQLYIEIHGEHHVFHTNYLEDVSNIDDIRDVIESKMNYNSPLNKFLKEIAYDFEIKIIDKLLTTDRIRSKVKQYIDEVGQNYASYNATKIKQYQNDNKQKYSDYIKQYWKDPKRKSHLRKFNNKYKSTVEWEYSKNYF